MSFYETELLGPTRITSVNLTEDSAGFCVCIIGMKSILEMDFISIIILMMAMLYTRICHRSLS